MDSTSLDHYPAASRPPRPSCWVILALCQNLALDPEAAHDKGTENISGAASGWALGEDRRPHVSRLRDVRGSAGRCYLGVPAGPP